MYSVLRVGLIGSPIEVSLESVSVNKVVCANEVVRSAMVAALVRLSAIAAFLAVERYPSDSSVVALVLIAYGGLNRFFAQTITMDACVCIARTVSLRQFCLCYLAPESMAVLVYTEYSMNSVIFRQVLKIRLV